MDTRRGYIFHFKCLLCRRKAKLSMNVMPANLLNSQTHTMLCANCFWNHVLQVHGPNIMREVDAKEGLTNEEIK